MAIQDIDRRFAYQPDLKAPYYPASFYIADSWVPEELQHKLKHFNPRTELGRIVRSCLKYVPVEAAAELIDAISRTVVVESSLALVHKPFQGREVNYGIVSRKVVTTAGVNFLVSAFANSVEPESLKFHGLGTGVAAESTSDTALGTELTTQYNPDNTRATGSTTTGSGANVYRTVATNTVDASAAVTEHGILSQAATGGGTLWDRSVFSVVNLASGDSLASTYDCTFTAGG